jgi:valyl-tRNA synthetase
LRGADAEETRRTLLHTLETILRLLHPFMPFLTEEIWQAAPHEGETIMLAPWPQPDTAYDDPAAQESMENTIALIKAVRALRTERGVTPSRRVRLHIQTETPEVFRAAAPFFEKLCGAADVTVGRDAPLSENPVVAATYAAKAYIPLPDLADTAAEEARIAKEIAAAEKNLAAVNARLADENFVRKAPAAIVQNQRDARDKLLAQLAALCTG